MRVWWTLQPTVHSTSLGSVVIFCAVAALLPSEPLPSLDQKPIFSIILSVRCVWSCLPLSLWKKDYVSFSASSKGLCDAFISSLIDSCAIRIASGLVSVVTQLRLVLKAEIAVVPLPQKGSNTHPPGGDDDFIILSNNFSGFCVGYLRYSSHFC